MILAQHAPVHQRLAQIDAMRRTVISEGRSAAGLIADLGSDASWIERSWRRCIVGISRATVYRKLRR